MGLSRGEERAAWYLAGIFDGEGCVSYTQGKRGLIQKVVEISNTDRSIIDTVVAALDELEILYNLRGPIHLREERWTPYYSIRLSNYDAIAKFARLVPFQSDSKREKIEHIVNSRYVMSREDWPVDEIERLYWEENMSCRDIASVLGIGDSNGHKRVIYYMEQVGIPRRSKSEAAKGRWSSSD